MLGVCGDDRGLEQNRRAISAADQDVGLAAVTEVFEDMGDGEEVALIVDEEAVAEETVVVAAGRRRLIELIDDGADRRGEWSVVSRLLGCGCDYEGSEEAGEQDRQAGRTIFGGLKHFGQRLLDLSEDTTMKVAAGRKAGKSRKRAG